MKKLNKMQKIKITRGFESNKQTLGLLQIIENEKVIYACYTLELPWRDNHHNISCIPFGLYKGKKITRPNGNKAISITDVPGRSAILIHKGNFYTDIRGCVLVGKSVKYLNKDEYMDVIYSTKTMKEILSVLKEDEFEINIK